MGSTVLVGVAAAVVAFFVVAIAWSQIIEQSLSGFAGLIAGYFAFKYFYDKDKKELEQLLHPPDQIWPVSLPVAWGCVTDVFRQSGVETGVSGSSVWQIVQEDDSRGFIMARLSFNQRLGVGANAAIVPREIHATVQFSPEQAATRVHCEYRILSPSGAGMVRELIQKNLTDFKTNMENHRNQ